MAEKEIDYEKTTDFEEMVRESFEDDKDLCDMREYADDIELVRQALKSIDIHPSHYTCFIFWKGYSYDLSASWLMLDKGYVVEIANSYIKRYTPKD